MIKVVLYVLYALLGVFATVAPIIYIKRKFGGSLKRVRDGIAVYLIFSSVLNAVLYTVLAVGFSLSEKIEKTALSSAVINAAILTLSATLGRIIWLKIIAKQEDSNGDALLFGAGYSSAYMVLSYVVTAIANSVISVITYVNENAEISTIFTSNINQVQNTNLYNLFLEIAQMLLIFVFEAAISVVFYCVILRGKDKKWLFAGILLHFLGSAVIRYSDISYSVIVLIFFALTVISAGLAHWLLLEKKE